MIDRKIFSERMKHARRERGLTLADIARKLSVVKQSVHTWENTKTLPTLDKAAALADLLGVSLDYLTGRTDRPEVNG